MPKVPTFDEKKSEKVGTVAMPKVLKRPRRSSAMEASKQFAIQQEHDPQRRHELVRIRFETAPVPPRAEAVRVGKECSMYPEVWVSLGFQHPLPVRAQRAKTSSYRGVSSQCRGSSSWRVEIRYAGKRHHVGTFDNEREAAKAYDTAARKHHGDQAILNFRYPEPKKHKKVGGHDGLLDDATPKKSKRSSHPKKRKRTQDDSGSNNAAAMPASMAMYDCAMYSTVFTALGFKKRKRGAGSQAI
jgi:hypothetical protein